jgi:hypothetical protein
MEVLIDKRYPGEMPIYDKCPGTTSLVARKNKVVKTKGHKDRGRETVCAYVATPTPKFLRTMARLLKKAKKMGKGQAILVIGQQNDGIGLVAP